MNYQTDQYHMEIRLNGSSVEQKRQLEREIRAWDRFQKFEFLREREQEDPWVGTFVLD